MLDINTYYIKSESLRPLSIVGEDVEKTVECI